MLVPSVSIQNKNGVAMLVDKEDLSFLTQHKNGYWNFRLDRGFVIVNYSGRTVAFHRLIMNFPASSAVKHTNKNSLDNRKENLRTGMDPKYEPKAFKLGRSKFRGVSKHGNNWRAVISIRGVTTHLGTFPTEVEAAKAYDAAAKAQHHKGGAVNFPDKVRRSIKLGSSKFRGVFRSGGNWRAGISLNHVPTYLGTFATEIEAAQAYDAAAKLQGCEFHFLNFPNEDTNA